MIDQSVPKLDSGAARSVSDQGGFTLTELLVVVCLIGILNGIALGIFKDYVTQAKLAEAIGLGSTVQRAVNQYYSYFGRWPNTYDELNLSDSLEDIHGKYSRADVFEKGALSYLFSQSQNMERPDGYVSFQPAVVPPSKPASFVWLCGYANPGDRFEMIGHNLTNVPPEHMPSSCR